jgi:hypothetical protein
VTLFLALALAAAPQAAPAPRPVSADARRIVAALGLDRQVAFMTGTLAPLFARQVLATLGSDPAFKAQLATAEGRARLETVLREEFEKAFRGRIPELVEAIARDYDAKLSPAELHSVAAFLSGGAGARWAATLSDVQQASSAVGAQLGAKAGAEAYAAVLARMDAKTGLVK